MHNDTLINSFKLDSTGNCKVTSSSLKLGIHTFTAKYSGNTIYSPKISNTLTIELVKKDTSSATSLKVEKDSPIKLVSINHKNYLKGTLPGDEIVMYNSIGHILSSFKASSDLIEINRQGVVLLKVKSGNCYYSFKTVL